jgi:hypothetical protein
VEQILFADALVVLALDGDRGGARPNAAKSQTRLW